MYLYIDVRVIIKINAAVVVVLMYDLVDEQLNKYQSMVYHNAYPLYMAITLYI